MCVRAGAHLAQSSISSERNKLSVIRRRVAGELGGCGGIDKRVSVCAHLTFGNRGGGQQVVSEAVSNVGAARQWWWWCDMRSIVCTPCAVLNSGGAHQAVSESVANGRPGGNRDSGSVGVMERYQCDYVRTLRCAQLRRNATSRRRL